MHFFLAIPRPALKWAAIAVALAALSGWSLNVSASISDELRLIGCWQGEDYQPVLGQTTTWLIQRKSDRTFQIEFGAPGEANQRETGRWAVDGQTYTTITSTINGKAIEPLGRQFTDVYLLRDVTSNSMTYYHVRMNLTFKSVKVACVNGD